MNTTAGVRRATPYAPTLEQRLAGSGSWARFRSFAESGRLALQVISIALTPPYSWVREAVLEGSLAIRRAALPLLAAHGVYVVGFGLILFGSILSSLGLAEREAGMMFVIWSREIATWVTAMIFAGIVGSAIAADLGSRKIREELDALDDLGVDRMRSLVVPRVVATTVTMPALALLSLFWINLVNFVFAPGRMGYSHSVLLENLRAAVQATDVYFPIFLKNLLIGFFVGVIACHKGISAGGGAEGVGRAVAETVVITFFGIWLFNSVFNLGYLTLFPEVSNLKA